MARTNAESLGELYARIGLNFDELENGFIEVERSLKQNLSRLNRANNVVRIQERIELLGLDESADAEKIFEIKSRSLNRQLENQRTRLRMLQAEYEDTARRTGTNSDETQRAEIAFENARLAVARLENQLEELNENHNRGTDWTERVVEFSKKVAPVISVVRSLIDVFGVMNDATERLIEKFRNLQSDSFKLNLPIQDAENFTQTLRLAGGELEDVLGFINGITDALTKGETDDPEYLALSKYGAEIFDATGRLKNFQEIFEEVRKAFEKARDAGEEVQFLQMLGGEAGVSDAMQAFSQWNDAVEDANTIIQANIDYDELRKADRALKQLSEQTDEFKDAVASAFQPSITAAAKNFFEILRVGTQWLLDHRSDIQNALEWNAPIRLFSNQKNFMLEAKQLTATIKNQATGLAEVFKASEGLEKAHAALKEKLNKKPKDNDALSQYGIQRAKAFEDELKALRIELDYENEYQKAIAEAELWKKQELTDKIHLSDREKAAINALYNAKIEQAEKDHADRMDELWQETASLQYEATHSAFEKEIRDIEIWKNSALDALGEYQDAIGDKNKWIEESAAILANAAAKEAQAVTKEIDRIKGKFQSLEEKIFELTHSQEEIDTMKLQKEVAEYEKEGIYSPERLLEYAKLAQKKINGKTYWDRDYLSEIQGGVNFNLADYGLKNPSLTEPILNDIKGLQITEFQTSIEIAGDSAANFANCLKSATDKISKFDIDFPKINFDARGLNEMTRSLSDLTKTAGDIAQKANQQSNTIEVKPNISISVNLGGAYVFDNALKNQLTTDITNNVASAVTSAVNQAASQLSTLKFGN